MSKLSELARLETEWGLAKDAFRNAHAEQMGITKAVQARIEAEKARDAERIQVLEDLLEDSGTSATAERMARLELDKLKAAVYGPTPEETELAEEAERDANQANFDVENLRRAFKTTYKEVKDSLSATYEAIVNDRQDHELRNRWISGEADKFSRLK